MKTMLRSSFIAYLSFSLICHAGISIPGYAQEKVSPRLDVAYFQRDSAVRYVSIKVRKKVGKRFEPVAADVNVFLGISGENVPLGTIASDAKGDGKILLSADVVTSMDNLDEYSFYAEIPETDSLEEVAEYLVIKPSRMKIVTDDSDSSIRVTVEAKTDGKWEPFEGAELAVFIQRRFGKILIGEESNATDENGVVDLTFDTEIPGDINGLVTLEATIEDNDELGNVYATTNTGWGTPLVAAGNFDRRTLWSTRDKTPWWLLVFPNAMIAGVWGVIIYLILLIFKMKRISRERK